MEFKCPSPDVVKVRRCGMLCRGALELCPSGEQVEYGKSPKGKALG